MLTMRAGKPTASERICCMAVTAIALWLGGLGCALRCGLDAVYAYCDEKPAASCHAAVRVEHCQAGSSDDRLTDSISRQAGLKDCSLLPNQATSLAVFSRDGDAPDLPLDHRALIDGIIPHKEIFIPNSLTYDRGQVYLLCCALLI
ncbi:MAG: hypothetical protein AB1631_05725 [Acidobacteriota bacterium]